ncbi:MAG: hypothetical protein HY537_19040 [Deltaproteobacteria bacterium]|nr:hypothetical protein [Deltaproteobacteria bacterium]
MRSWLTTFFLTFLSIESFGLSIASNWHDCVSKEVRTVLSTTSYKNVRVNGDMKWEWLPRHYVYSFAARENGESYSGMIVVAGKKIGPQSDLKIACWLVDRADFPSNEKVFRLLDKGDRPLHEISGDGIPTFSP